MTGNAVELAFVSALCLASTGGAAALTYTINAGPGTSLSATSSSTFYVNAPGLITFSPAFPLGTSPTCTQSGAGTWGCSYDVNDRIVLQTSAASLIDSAVISGSAGLGTAGGGNSIVTSTICAGPAQIGFVNCTANFLPGAYVVSLSLNESIDTRRLVNSVAVPGTLSLSVTISGPTVSATPEPATMGMVALAFGFCALARRRTTTSTRGKMPLWPTRSHPPEN